MDYGKTIRQYAGAQYKQMFREPDGRLTHKFIVPGSVYSNTLWDWDSWLTDIALRQFVTEDISEYEKGCILNFLENSTGRGEVHIMLSAESAIPSSFNGNTNIHKPCLAQHAAFIIKNNGEDAEWLRHVFPRLLRFIDCYMGNFRHKSGLYFWINDSAIGVDNDPCTFYRPDRSSGSILLNCLMYKELEAVCYIAGILGVPAEKYRAEAQNLKKTVQNLCYDEKDGFYYSADLGLRPIDPNTWLHSGAPRHWDSIIQRIGVWSGFLAMWCGIATPEQAERMVKENLLDPNAFWANYGVTTLSKYEKMYLIRPSGNPSCWLGPVWGISNYFVFRALVKYGYDKQARELALKTAELLGKDIAQCGQMHEYYHPDTGAPVINPGFQNWNLLVLNMLAWMDGENAVTEF